MRKLLATQDPKSPPGKRVKQSLTGSEKVVRYKRLSDSIEVVLQERKPIEEQLAEQLLKERSYIGMVVHPNQKTNDPISLLQREKEEKDSRDITNFLTGHLRESVVAFVAAIRPYERPSPSTDASRLVSEWNLALVLEIKTTIPQARVRVQNVLLGLEIIRRTR
jgi:exonuclease III